MKYKRALFVPILLLATGYFQAQAQVIPADRAFFSAWRSAGYAGAIPSPTKIINVRDFGALGNGTDDDRPAISAALAALGGEPGVVFFPSGTYILRSTLSLPAGAVLRGQRADATTLRLDFLGNGIVIAGTTTGYSRAIVSGYTLHSNTLTLSDTAGLAVGDDVELHQDNATAWNASTWSRFGQIGKIAAIDGQVLTLAQPLRFTYTNTLNPTLAKILPIRGVGLENFKIDRLIAGADATARDNLLSVYFYYAADCWMRGVEGYNAFGAHVSLDYSTQVSVTGCYFHHAHEYDGGGSGYGVKLEYKSGECLVENNIFQKLRHAILLQATANGNVCGYNYSRENNWVNSGEPADLTGDIVLHGNMPHANLFEGNIAQHIWIDDSHGQNGPLNTFLRNRAELRGINATSNQTAGQNYIGNEAAKNTYKLFFVLRPGDGWSPRGSDNFQHGNNTESDGLQLPGTGTLVDYSYYLNADPTVPPTMPEWWAITNVLPVIGPPHVRTTTKTNPAYARWFGGGNLTIAPPSLARQPTDRVVLKGQPCVFEVEAYGTPSASYQWLRDGIPLQGKTAPQLSIATCHLSNSGSYTCLVSDDLGSVLSAPAILDVRTSASFVNELTSNTVGWIKTGISKHNWVTTIPPAVPYLTYDNIQGTTQVGTYTLPLLKRFEGTDVWAATVNAFVIKGTGTSITWNYLYIGMIETNGWVSSDFAGVRVTDNNSAIYKNVAATVKDGSTTWAGADVPLAVNTEYRIDMGYTNKVVTTRFTRTSDNALVGTSTAIATGTPSFSWGSFGFGNGSGLAYESNSFSISQVRDVSFSTPPLPPDATLFMMW